jgi:hypothetical protein
MFYVPLGKISQYVPIQSGATEYIRNTFPLFLTFLEDYYESLEQPFTIMENKEK